MQTAVVAYGQRSITALPYPIRINHLSIQELKWIPGISPKSAAKLIMKMPFRSPAEFLKAAPDARALVPYMDFQ